MPNPVFFQSDATISPNLKAAIDAYSARLEAAENQLKQSNPEIGEAERRAALFIAGIETRDTDAQLAEKCRLAADLAGRPQSDKNQKYLNGFFSMKAAKDPVPDPDLSCLTSENTGKRGPDGLSQSEHNFLSYFSLRMFDSALLRARENSGFTKDLTDVTPYYVQAKQRSELLGGTVDRFINQSVLKNAGCRIFENAADPHGLVPGPLPGDCSGIGLALANARKELQSTRKNPMTGALPAEEPEALSFTLSEQNDLSYTEKEDLLESTSLSRAMDDKVFAVFRGTLDPLFEGSKRKADMADMGMDMYDLIKIDGKSVRERCAFRFTHTMDANAREHMMAAEVMRALYSGKERVDCVTPQRDSFDHPVLHVTALQPDLHAYDGAEKKAKHTWLRRVFDWGLTKIETDASKADQMYRKDAEESLDGRHRQVLRETHKLADSNRKARDDAAYSSAAAAKAVSRTKKLQDDALADIPDDQPTSTSEKAWKKDDRQKVTLNQLSQEVKAAAQTEKSAGKTEKSAGKTEKAAVQTEKAAGKTEKPSGPQTNEAENKHPEPVTRKPKSH